MDNKTDQRYIGIPSMHKPEILRELSTVYNYILKEEVYFLINKIPTYQGYASYSYDLRNECKSLLLE